MISGENNLSWAQLEELYRNVWPAARVVDSVADDVFTGATIICEDEEVREWIYEKTHVFIEGLRQARLYGGGIFVGGKHELRFLAANCLDVSTNKLSSEGFPLEYTLVDGQGRPGSIFKEEESVRLIGRDLPYIRKRENLFWGDSEIQVCYSAIQRFTEIIANMTYLTKKSNLTTLKSDSLLNALMTKGASAGRRIAKVLEAQTMNEDIYSTRIISTSDDIQRDSISFVGLNDVFASACFELSGASQIPQTVLFGRSPQGMNATGESDQINYQSLLRRIRENKLLPAIKRCVKLYLGKDVDILVKESVPLETLKTALELPGVSSLISKEGVSQILEAAGIPIAIDTDDVLQGEPEEAPEKEEGENLEEEKAPEEEAGENQEKEEEAPE